MESQNGLGKETRKVLHIITKGSPLGGAQKYVLEVATRLARNFEVVVAVGRGDDLPQALVERGIRTLSIPSLGRDIDPMDDVRSFLALVNLIKAERPDIVHLNSSKIGLLGALAVHWVRGNDKLVNMLTRTDSRPHIRCVFTAHAWASNEQRPRPIKYLLHILHWLTVLMADVTIAVSEKTRQDVLGMPFVNGKIITIYTGIAPFMTLPREAARQELSATYGIPENTLWIGTLSELHKNKGVDLAIEALSHLTDASAAPAFSYIVFGGGSQQQALTEQIRFLGMEDKVFLLGPVPDAKRYLAAFDIFSLTSRTEALPLALLEAGMCGLPCLATYVGGIPEIIRNRVSGVLVDPLVPDMVKGFELLLNDEEKRSFYGDTLKKKIESDISIDRMMEALVKVYCTPNSSLLALSR